MDWTTLWSDSSWTEWHCGHRQFMDWMALQSQTCSSCTEWHCSHKQKVHGLNGDIAVTNTLFMDWMAFQSQTGCSWPEWWHCDHKQAVHGLNDDTVVTDWMILLSQIHWPMQQPHQTVYGLKDTTHAHSFNNLQHLRPKVLWAVPVRIQVYCDVKLCGWVSGSTSLKVPQYLDKIRNHTPKHTVSHPRTNAHSFHINYLALLFPESLSTTFSGVIFCFCWEP
jgi:hypothetical protein